MKIQDEIAKKNKISNVTKILDGIIEYILTNYNLKIANTSSKIVSTDKCIIETYYSHVRITTHKGEYYELSIGGDYLILNKLEEPNSDFIDFLLQVCKDCHLKGVYIKDIDLNANNVVRFKKWINSTKTHSNLFYEV